MLGGSTGGGDKGLRMSLMETLSLAWKDPELNGRIKFVLLVFAVYALGVQVPVPIAGVDPGEVTKNLVNNPLFASICARV